MEEGGADTPVTLIIRAPNQKHHDQTITCFLHWTVEDLKKHLTHVYPSKPLLREQRLVYSGRLLQDQQQLRDVLRKHDEYHMLHLVCAPRTPPADPCVTSNPGSAESDSAPSSSLANQNGSTHTGSSDGVRHRGDSTDAQQRPEGVVFPAAPPAALPPHSMYSAVQVMWWQRVYAQHYYMHYHTAMAAAQAPPPPANPAPSVALAPVPVNPAPVLVNPAPLEQPANRNPQMNAQGGAVQNEDELNRDWLDWLYTVSRTAVLLSIVYFYSSFSRFVMVIGAMLLIYLHQAGWFPFRVELQNRDRPPAENHRNHNMQEMERIMDDGLEDDDDDGESGDEGPDEAAPPHLNVLTATWSFISTFFTSLVPEGPHRAAR